MTAAAGTHSVSFHWADYVVFILFLVLFSAIGLFHGIKTGRSKSARDFLTGGGKMHYAPVALSMMASFVSAIFVMSIPAEMYVSGSGYCWLALSYFIGYPIAAHVHLPVFYRLGVTSGYQYLELRFNKLCRVIGCIVFMITMVLYLAVVMYTPSLALSQVTGIPLLPSILGIGLVVTFYTAFGGMKATIWNDAIQMITVFIGFVLVISLGSAKSGGLGNVFTLAWDNGRIQAVTDPNPFIRTSLWTHVLGGAFFSINLYAGSQIVIQKFLSTSSVREGQKAVWLSSITTAILMVMVMTIGQVMYAFYQYCDPLKAGVIARKDQVAPLFVMHVMGNLHGLPGLFVATAFSGTLSTVSGGMNAVSAVFLEDILKPIYHFLKNEDIAASTGTLIARVAAIVFGLMTIGLAFLTEHMGSLVVQIAVMIFGMIGAPLTGLITLGMLFESANVWGGLAGLAVSTTTMCWLGMGAILTRVPGGEMNTRTDGCGTGNASWYFSGVTHSMLNLTNFDSTTALPADIDVPFSTNSSVAEEPFILFQLSYMYYSLVGILIVLLVGIPISLLTGGNKMRPLQDDRLFFNFKEFCSNYESQVEGMTSKDGDELKALDVCKPADLEEEQKML